MRVVSNSRKASGQKYSCILLHAGNAPRLCNEGLQDITKPQLQQLKAVGKFKKMLLAAAAG